ncbi:hypothetical protein [Halalkalicoccus salilacus]|uniref:hypothetical protein n=1 Tax=Halalkalicoccus TaxID=332246 RepID=UPI002F9686B5
MAKGQGELLVGLEISESVRVGVGGSARFGIKIVFEYIENLANGAVDGGIRVSWIEIDPDLIAR